MPGIYIVTAKIAGFQTETQSGRTGWKEPAFLENVTGTEVQEPSTFKPSIERAVRTEHWKLILRDQPRSELYDLEKNPAERNDLFAGAPDTVKQLAGLILDWGNKTGDPVAVKLASAHI